MARARANAGHLAQVRCLVIARPDRGHRHEVAEIDGVQNRTTDVGVDMPGQSAEPGVAAVERLISADEASRLDRLLDGLHLPPCQLEVFVPDDDGGGEVAEADSVLD